MAEAQAELKTGKARKRTGNATRKTTSRTTKNETRKRTRGGKASSQDGLELLRQAADRRLARDSEELADLISEKALTGDLASTKTLVGLAAGKKPLAEQAKKRCGLSEAQRLANEPAWQGQEEEEAEEV